MKRKIFHRRSPNSRGFTLIEVVLALGVFLLSIMALVGLLGPMMDSVENIERMDEISSVVNTVNTFLQASPDIAARGAGGAVTKSKFDAIYEAVRTGDEATIFVYRYYNDNTGTEDEPRIGLEVGFAPAEQDIVGANSIVNDPAPNPAAFNLAAGPIYRVVLSASSATPETLRSSRGDATGVYTLTNDLASYPEGYLALEVRIFTEDAPGPDGSAADVPATDLVELNRKEPDFTFNTAIVR